MVIPLGYSIPTQMPLGSLPFTCVKVKVTVNHVSYLNEVDAPLNALTILLPRVAVVVVYSGLAFNLISLEASVTLVGCLT